jgi:hypothetical protein
MARKELALALGLAVVASPLSATSLQPAAAAPPPSPGAKYCMRVEPPTGSRIETVECWTREEWANLGVDVDKDWAKEGVEVRA